MYEIYLTALPKGREGEEEKRETVFFSVSAVTREGARRGRDRPPSFPSHSSPFPPRPPFVYPVHHVV
eukprot:scaffold131875_cov24-Tisochrysis_lutea.AAC.3